MNRSVKIGDEDYRKLKKIARIQKRTFKAQISIILNFFERVIIKGGDK